MTRWYLVTRARPPVESKWYLPPLTGMDDPGSLMLIHTLSHTVVIVDVDVDADVHVFGLLLWLIR